MPRHSLRIAAAMLLASACTHQSDTAATEAASAAPSAHTYTITLSTEHPVAIAEEGLSVELVSVKDGLCPSDVQCVWAGHASVALKVSRSGLAPETVLVGTRAPSTMKLPFEADLGDYHFSLVNLEPARTSASQPALSQYKVTIQVTRR